MAAAPSVTAQAILERLAASVDRFTPEVQRAARWLADHPSDAALLSMRQQARAVGVSPPTMLRLARALGCEDYGSLRRPFQEAMAGQAGEFRRSAFVLESAKKRQRTGRVAREMAVSQAEDVQSALTLNSPSHLDAAVDLIARARSVGFLGVRACFAIAFQFRYAYNLIAANGVLLEGMGGTLLDQAETLGPGDALVVIIQQPYSAPAVQAAQAAASRGVSVVALTDSGPSPLAECASQVLRFGTVSASFFPSMVGPLALVELLLARLAARGGKAMLERLATGRRRDTHEAHSFYAGRRKPDPITRGETK
jgi:DNA-binding MurR/RpiR family transcriptional regulator